MWTKLYHNAQYNFTHFKDLGHIWIEAMIILPVSKPLFLLKSLRSSVLETEPVINTTLVLLTWMQIFIFYFSNIKETEISA